MSTLALMRGAVLQLHRWGVLDAVRAAGTPAIRSTSFHYGSETIRVPIKERHGVDALFAPRRTVLDPVLVDAAAESGAHFAFGLSVVDLIQDGDGRVRGAVVAGGDRLGQQVAADVVIGADGLRSRVARLVGAEVEHAASHQTASIYGFWPDLEVDGNQWHYTVGAGVGAIPTNHGETCVFVSMPPARFHDDRHLGLEALHRRTLQEAAPGLADQVSATGATPPLRAFPGTPAFLRRSAGPGWALVGDAGYFKDPFTAHGITDALRDAELLARAIRHGTDAALRRYQHARDGLAQGFLDVTDRIASFDWTLEEVKALHLTLSHEMKREVDFIHGLGPSPRATQATPGGIAPALSTTLAG
jgi:2-polyprenyl-6-methoxyphenol hydroxylase-like FAD-dependent oxidoreductase